MGPVEKPLLSGSDGACFKVFGPEDDITMQGFQAVSSHRAGRVNRVYWHVRGKMPPTPASQIRKALGRVQGEGLRKHLMARCHQTETRLLPRDMLEK